MISTHPLPKRLGLREATALVISNVIGTGIFTVPAIVGVMVPSAPAVLALWVAGGLLALCGALSYGATTFDTGATATRAIATLGI